MERDQMRSPIPVALALLIMVAVCLSSSCAARTPEQLKEDQEELTRGFRKLLEAEAGKPAPTGITYSKAAIDPNRDCSNKFPKLNYKPVTSVCKPKVPATRACCAAFNKFACQFRSQVNNFNSICPIMFMSYLNYAGGYQDGYFIGKCIDGKKGLCV